jgi:hypothetical protein
MLWLGFDSKFGSQNLSISVEKKRKEWVQRVIPRSDVQKLISTGDIPRTGIKDTMLDHSFVIATEF